MSKTENYRFPNKESPPLDCHRLADGADQDPDASVRPERHLWGSLDHLASLRTEGTLSRTRGHRHQGGPGLCSLLQLIRSDHQVGDMKATEYLADNLYLGTWATAQEQSSSGEGWRESSRGSSPTLKMSSSPGSRRTHSGPHSSTEDLCTA